MSETGTEYQLFKNQYIDDIEKIKDCFIPVFDEVINWLPKDRKLKILDAGCGDGSSASYLKKRLDCFLAGVDGSDYALDKARKNGFDLVKKVDDLSVCELPFEPGSFDLVICKDVFEHLLLPMNLLQQMKKVLKKDGFLLVHCPNHFPLIKRLKFLFDGKIDTFGYFPDAKQWEFPHIRYFTSAGFREFVGREGFRTVANLDRFFPVNLPVVWRLPGYRRVFKQLMDKYPDQFVEAYTWLLKAQ